MRPRRTGRPGRRGPSSARAPGPARPRRRRRGAPPSTSDTAGTIATSPSAPRRGTAISASRRTPSRPRARCTTAATPEASWLWVAARSRPAASASASSRAGTSTAELACRVPQPPSWPVLRAASRSTTSAPRTSPTTSRSGRIRRACRTRVRSSMAPTPSTLAGPPLERDDVGMVGAQLGCVLDEDQPLGRVDQGEQGGEQRRLAAAGAPADQERDPGRDQRLQQLGAAPGQGAGVEQLVEGEGPRGRHPQRDRGAGSGHRREHGVTAAAVGQPQVGERRGVVEAPTGHARRAAGRADAPTRRRRTGRAVASSPSPRST